MSKSKRARSIKPRAGFKTRSKLARKVAGQHHRRAHSKQAQVLTLLRRPSGATIATRSRLAPDGSRTRCGGSLRGWCARSSGSSFSPIRRTARACIGLLATSFQPPSLSLPVSRGLSHAPAANRRGRDRGRGRSHPRARPGWASTDVASGFRPHAACEPEHGPAGSHDRLAHPGAGLRRS